MRIPRLIISAFSGGAGKTMISLGLARAFARKRQHVRALKKGPDYIDAAWLAQAAQSAQANLDPFFTPGPALLERFSLEAKGADLVLIEGNRGLFDGLDIDGSCSTAELARILSTPVLLVLDCTKMTRTAAALVKGCLHFEDGVTIGGVILNRTGNPRHQAMVRRAVEELAGVPVFGVLPRNRDILLRERHMGLTGLDENAEADAWLDGLADFVGAHLDLDAVKRLAASAPPLPDNSAPLHAIAAPDNSPVRLPGQSRERRCEARPRIGVVRDAAFWFYYRENLEALEQAGAELLPLSLLEDAVWPDIHGLYIGGGLPELHAERLSANTRLRCHVAALADRGLPIFAECGGFLYLADSLTYKGRRYPMAGVFSCSVEFCDRPQGLGYVEAEVVGENPFFPLGARFRGHEFHFSRCLAVGPRDTPAGDLSSDHILRLDRGRGMGVAADRTCFDGLLRYNTFAAYMHCYAPALPDWAPAFVSLSRTYQNGMPAHCPC